MTVFKKMFIAFDFLFSSDTEKLKTSLYFSRQDASKYAYGDLEKSVFKFDPRSGLLTLTHCSKFANLPKILRIEI